MIRETFPEVVSVNDSNFDEITTLDLPALIAFASPEDTEFLNAFRSVAAATKENIVCGVSTDSSLSGVADFKSPFLVAYSTLDEAKPALYGEMSMSKMLNFAEAVTDPVIGRLDLASFAQHRDVRICHPEYKRCINTSI